MKSVYEYIYPILDPLHDVCIIVCTCVPLCSLHIFVCILELQIKVKRSSIQDIILRVLITYLLYMNTRSDRTYIYNIKGQGHFFYL